MTSHLEKSLLRTAVSTFEELGFLMPNEEPFEAAPGAQFVAVGVEFKGPCAGFLSIAVTPGLLAEIAANMTGESAVVADDIMNDALKEVCNVLCGNLLPEIGGASARFTIDAPRMLSPAEGARGGEIEAKIGFDSGGAVVRLSIADGAGEVGR